MDPEICWQPHILTVEDCGYEYNIDNRKISLIISSRNTQRLGPAFPKHRALPLISIFLPSRQVFIIVYTDP
jgi:hypothetical protein